MNAEGNKKVFNQLEQEGNQEVLPLFPLGLWLFPTISLPLQIFEQRYLSMISERLKTNAGFGIVPIREGSEVGGLPSIYPVGVEVKVVDWYQQDNGLLGIKVCGAQRFRVSSIDSKENKLMLGQVDRLVEEEALPLSELHTGLTQLLLELKRHPHAKALDLSAPTNNSELSYQLAQLLPFDAEKKEELMMASSAEGRLMLIADHVFELANE